MEGESMTDGFVINYINEKIRNVKNPNYIEYSFFELKVKNNLSDEEIQRFLKINKDYFENKNYQVYFTGSKFKYNNEERIVAENLFMVAIKE